MKKLFFALLLSLIVTNVSTFTMENTSEKDKDNQDNNFYSIILPGLDNKGGEDYHKNHVVNVPYKRYKRLNDWWSYDLGQDNCICHFKKQLKLDENAKDRDILLHGVNFETAAIINLLAQLKKEKQKQVKCITLESVFCSGNIVINNAIEKASNIYLPFAKFWTPWFLKCIFPMFPSYNPLGKQSLSSVKNLPKSVPILVMQAKFNDIFRINEARKFYLELNKYKKNNYLIEVTAWTSFNILDLSEPDTIKAIQAIYRKHNLPYNKDILPDEEQPDLSQFQPSSDEVKERIKHTGRWKRIFTNCIDFTIDSILFVVILTKIISKFR